MTIYNLLIILILSPKEFPRTALLSKAGTDWRSVQQANQGRLPRSFAPRSTLYVFQSEIRNHFRLNPEIAAPIRSCTLRMAEDDPTKCSITIEKASNSPSAVVV